LETTVTFTGVKLDRPSKDTLKEIFTPPPEWSVHIDHVTIKLGAYTLADKEKFGYEIGDVVNFHAIELGMSDKAMAVKVEGVLSTNKIPHVTLAVAPHGKPKNSNDIKEWMPMPKIPLSGVVKEWKVTGLKENKKEISKKTTTRKLNIGSIVLKIHPQVNGKTVGSAVQSVLTWMKEKGLEGTEDNEAVIEAFITNELKLQ